MKLYTYTWILIIGLFLAFGAAWLISGYKPSEFVILVLMIGILGETVNEGVQIVCKRLDAISEILQKNPNSSR